MKNKIFIVVLSLCAVCIALFSAGCSNSGELEKQIADLQQQVEQLTEENEELSSDKGGLESQLAALQKEFETLKSENSLTEEQLADLQFKFEKLMEVDWLCEDGYVLNELIVEVKQEYINNIYQVNDFKPVKLVKIEQSKYDKAHYILTLADSGVQYLAEAVPKLFGLEFVYRVMLNTYNKGA